MSASNLLLNAYTHDEIPAAVTGSPNRHQEHKQHEHSMQHSRGEDGECRAGLF